MDTRIFIITSPHSATTTSVAHSISLLPLQHRDCCNPHSCHLASGITFAYIFVCVFVVLGSYGLTLFDTVFLHSRRSGKKTSSSKLILPEAQESPTARDPRSLCLPIPSDCCISTSPSSSAAIFNEFRRSHSLERAFVCCRIGLLVTT